MLARELTKSTSVCSTAELRFDSITAFQAEQGGFTPAIANIAIAGKPIIDVSSRVCPKYAPLQSSFSHNVT